MDTNISCCKLYFQYNLNLTSDTNFIVGIQYTDTIYFILQLSCTLFIFLLVYSKRIILNLII